MEEEIESAVDRRGWTEDAEDWIRLRRGSCWIAWFGGEFGAVRGCAKSRSIISAICVPPDRAQSKTQW